MSCSAPVARARSSTSGSSPWPATSIVSRTSPASNRGAPCPTWWGFSPRSDPSSRWPCERSRRRREAAREHTGREQRGIGETQLPVIPQEALVHDGLLWGFAMRSVTPQISLARFFYIHVGSFVALVVYGIRLARVGQS